MHKWRLLLLAIVAIFQPIATFTERNLVDGTKDCCGRETDAVLRNSKTSLYGTNRLVNKSSQLRRLNHQDGTREDPHYELRQNDAIFSRRVRGRYHQGITKRTGQSLSVIARSTRAQFQRETNDESKELRLDVQRRERNLGNIRDVEQNRRTLNRIPRDTIMRHDDQTKVLSKRNVVFRDDSRNTHIGSENRFKNEADSARERMQVRYGDLRRLTVNVRDNLRQMRERLNTVRRESLARDNVRSYMDRERRETTPVVKQDREHRRSVSENTVAEVRIHDMRRRESVFPDDVKRYMNSERRETTPVVKQNREQRRSLSEGAVAEARIHDMRRRESLLRDDVRRYMDRERRETTLVSKQQSEQRRSLSKNAVTGARMQDMRRRESLLRDDVRRYMDRERREIMPVVKHDRGQRRSLSENAVAEALNHNMRRRESLLRDDVRRNMVKERRETTPVVKQDREQRRSFTENTVAEARNHDLRRRESLLRDDVRRYMDRERRETISVVQQHREQRRSLSENAAEAERIHDMRLKVNSRDERRNHIGARRLMSNRLSVDREVNKDHSYFKHQTNGDDFRTSMRVDRRAIREYRQRNEINSRIDRAIEGRRNIRSNEIISIETRDDRLIREKRLNSERMQQSVLQERKDRGSYRGDQPLERRVSYIISGETEARLRRFDDVFQRREDSRRRLAYGNKMENRVQNAVDTGLQNIEEHSRNNYMLAGKVATENEIGSTNWQYMLYTLQGAYLCGLLMQLLTPNHSKKSNMINLLSWSRSPQDLIKVD